MNSVSLSAHDDGTLEETSINVIRQEEGLGHDFKVYGDFQNPLFLAKDVAEWIDYSKVDGKYKVSQMLASVDEDEKVLKLVNITSSDTNNVDTTSKARRTQEMWLLTENGLYEVLMLSRKPVAKEFKKQVKKILHEIRTSGGYTVPRSYAEALQIAADQAKKIEEQQKQIETMQPKAVVYDEFVSRDKFCNFRDGANYLRMKQSDFMTLLKSKYIYKNESGEYRCYADYSEYFTLRPFTRGDKTRQQLMLTIRGLEFFKDKILESA